MDRQLKAELRGDGQVRQQGSGFPAQDRNPPKFNALPMSAASLRRRTRRYSSNPGMNRTPSGAHRGNPRGAQKLLPHSPNRLAHPPRQPVAPPQRGRNPIRSNKEQPDFHRKTISSRRFLLTSRPISYIMLTKKSSWISSHFRVPLWALPGSRLSPTSCPRFSPIFVGRVRS
jgi:hypothetical protein